MSLDETLSAKPSEDQGVSLARRGASRTERSTGLGSVFERWSQRRLFRSVVLVFLLVILELWLFHGYITGSTIPPWDFLGSYNTDAYVWWTQGSFFAPIDWSTSAWAGYPAALVLQNSAWYLPVGIASLFGPFTLHSAAILGALHVAFGSLGTYFLVRSMKTTFVVGLLATAAGFFAVGYFSNAEHVDITRGYALMPWALLALSSRWPWKKAWSIPLAALVLWQTVTGIYPGMLIALGYVGIVWVIFWQLIERPRFVKYLLPMGLASLAAILLSLPRLLPYALLQGGVTAGLPETSRLTPTSIGTLLFGYGATSLPNDISMRSFFIPAAILALALFARWHDRTTKAGLAIGVPAVLLGMPFWPWYDVEQSLPGLGLSRFTMSDFKVFFILGIVLLACSGLTRMLELSQVRQLPTSLRWSFGAAAVLTAVLAIAGIRGPYSGSDWAPGLLVFVLSLGVIAVFIIVRTRKAAAGTFSAALIALTIVSGVIWANTTAQPWNAPRVESETATYGSTVSALISQRSHSERSVQRPARTPLGSDRSRAQQLSVVWNSSFYSGRDAVGGYINLKGSTTEAKLQSALADPQTGPAFADFLASPGLVLTTSRSTPSSAELEDCASARECGRDVIRPVAYRPGSFDYNVSAARYSLGFLNEAYFSGWDAEACSSTGSCMRLKPSQSSLGIIKIELPAGHYDLRLRYKTAGRTEGWVMFGFGAFIAVGAMAFVGARSVLRRRNTA